VSVIFIQLFFFVVMGVVPSMKTLLLLEMEKLLIYS
jgi:hypothetical protein